MKFTILTQNLKKGLSLVEKVTGKITTLPILNNVLIETLPNFLKLTTTDLELGIQWWGLSKIQDNGKIAVPAKIFYQLINNLNQEKVEIKEKNKTLYIETENYKAQIKGTSADDFPIIPNFSKEKFIEINPLILKEGLEKVVDIISPTQSRPEISGVYFIIQKNGIKLVGTDSFRLAEENINNVGENKFKNLFEKELHFILPQRAAKELINILSDTEKNLKIYFSESQILFETQMKEIDQPEINLISRLIEGEYPSYQEIIPKNIKTQIILNKEEFINQIKLASLFSGRANEIKLKIDPKKNFLEIISSGEEFGEGKSNLIPKKISGEKLDISFNWRFLLDGVLNLKSSEFSFEFQNDSSAAIIRPVGDLSYFYIVMPIKPT